MPRDFTRLAALLVLCAVLNGCTAFQKDRGVEVIGLGDKPRPMVLAYDSTSRGAYVTSVPPEVRLCAEPVPDVALENLVKLTGNLTAQSPSGPSGSAEATTEVQAKVVELAGRSQLVLLAREMLYRACEYSLNHPTDTDGARAMFKSTTDVLEKLGAAADKQADAAKAQADANRTQAATDAAKTLETLSGDAKKSLDEYLKGSKK